LFTFVEVEVIIFSILNFPGIINYWCIWSKEFLREATKNLIPIGLNDFYSWSSILNLNLYHNNFLINIISIIDFQFQHQIPIILDPSLWNKSFIILKIIQKLLLKYELESQKNIFYRNIRILIFPCCKKSFRIVFNRIYIIKSFEYSETTKEVGGAITVPYSVWI